MMVRPLDLLKHWLHLVVIAVVLLGLIMSVKGQDWFNFERFLEVGVVAVILDVLGHKFGLYGGR